jgi:hypothetical protein
MADTGEWVELKPTGGEPLARVVYFDEFAPAPTADEFVALKKRLQHLRGTWNGANWEPRYIGGYEPPPSVAPSIATP